MYKLFFTLRYLRKRRIAYFAIAAVTLCVAMVLIVMSVMGGWLDQVKNRARGLLGDIVVDNQDQRGFPLFQEFIDEIQAWPEIVRATPVVYTYGLLTFPRNGWNAYVQVVGIRLQDTFDVNAFKKSLYYEKFFPGTTTLAEQKWPRLGVLFDRPPWRTPDGAERPVFALPAPYQEKLEKTQSEYRAAHGRPLEDPDSVDTDLVDILKSGGQEIIPGEWSLSRDEEKLLTAPAYTDNELPGAIVGRDIIGTRKSDGKYERFFPKGETIHLTLSPGSIAGRADTKPTVKGFRYADDSRTGIYEIDSRQVYVDFDRLQNLIEMDAADRVDKDGNVVGRWRARCSQIQIKCKPGVDTEALAARLTKHYQGLSVDSRFSLDEREMDLFKRLEAQTWQLTQKHIIVPVEKERMIVTILFGIISMVAVALILCILYMIVLEKTRDIGIIKAVGGSSNGVAAIWIGYGFSVGVVGAIFGSLLGTVFVWNINRIQDFLIYAFNFRVWDMKVYSFDSIPQAVNPVEAVTIAIMAVIVSTLGSLVPAWRAGSMQPVEAIRYE